MIGDRVRWAYTFDDPAANEQFKARGGIVRAVTLGPNSVWHVLVQHDDGTYTDELATNLALTPAYEPGSPADVIERDAAELEAKLAACSDAIIGLADYIVSEGLTENVFGDGGPCAAAIDLLKTFKAELLSVGTARDTAIAERDEAVSRLTSACDIFKAERDAAVGELETLKKRKRGPGRVSEDA